jgi:DNA-binding transcriptional ArsR family regulator
MKDIMVINDYKQLKALSDPFKSELMFRLINKSFTGQQLSEIYNLSRSRIHYHLRELEKVGLIKIVKTEEKNGIVQKFYQSVAKGFITDTSLMPREEANQTAKTLVINGLEHTKSKVLAVSEEVFQSYKSSSDPSESGIVSSIWKIEANEEDFKKWIKKYYELKDELSSIINNKKNESGKKSYYIYTLAFETNDPSEDS